LRSKFERLDHVHLTDLTADQIRRRILRREIESGMQIPVDEIAGELGVSRTPVIDALKQLANEGLVEILPRRGCFVRGLTEQDVREIFEAREAIEVYCASHAILHGRHRALAERLLRAIHAMEALTRGDQYAEIEAFIAADKAFHDAIVLTSENHRLHATYANLNSHMHVLRVSYFSALDLPQRVATDHLAIHHAIRDGDARAATAAVQHHLRHFCTKMVNYLHKHGGAI
jgi:DNA-binding GntR family transcriptional regulator